MIPAKHAAYPVYFSDNPLILTWSFPAPTAKLTSSAAIQREVIASVGAQGIISNYR
jgi:hypothetical protein